MVPLSLYLAAALHGTLRHLVYNGIGAVLEKMA